MSDATQTSAPPLQSSMDNTGAAEAAAAEPRSSDPQPQSAQADANDIEVQLDQGAAASLPPNSEPAPSASSSSVPASAPVPSHASAPPAPAAETMDGAAPPQPQPQLPPTRIVKLRGEGARMTAGGLYMHYSETFPPALSSALSEAEFSRWIELINDNLANNSPCVPCQCAQYVCCPFTLGCSVCVVRAFCQSQARRSLNSDLTHANHAARGDYGQDEPAVQWRLGESLCDSWIEIELLGR